MKLSSWEKSVAYIKSVYGSRLKQGRSKYLSNGFLPKEKGKVICEQYGTMQFRNGQILGRRFKLDEFLSLFYQQSQNVIRNFLFFLASFLVRRDTTTTFSLGRIYRLNFHKINMSFTTIIRTFCSLSVVKMFQMEYFP